MPNKNTFQIQPIKEFVEKYILKSKCSCDPFARNSRLATYTNDINPNTNATFHLDACDFIKDIAEKNVKCDLAIFDPPYSPRQITECYDEFGMECGFKDTQNAALYSRVRKALLKVLSDDAVVLSFGWNSGGMGMGNGFVPVEIMLVCHGSAHNDTICMAERRIDIELATNQPAYQPSLL